MVGSKMKSTLECPVHSGENLKEDANKITYKEKEYTKYHCILCSCYYIHTGTTELKKVQIGTIRGTNKAVYDTRIIPSLSTSQAPTTKNVSMPIAKANDITTKEKKKTTKK